MLTIVIGVFLALLMLKLKRKKKGTDEEGLIQFIALLIVLASVVLGLFYPLKYGNKELIKEVNLVPFKNETLYQGKGYSYILISANGDYLYRHEIESEFNTKTSKAYEIGKVSNVDLKHVTEIVDKKCKKPVLRIYKSDSLMTPFTFGLERNKYEYVFYVPVGTIKKAKW